MKAREGKAATQAYAALRSIASDVSQLEAVRCAALDACRTDPSAEYVDILQGALRQTELSALQHAAARLAIGRDSLRAALREALYNYGSLDVVTAAAGGLLKGEQKDIDFVRSFIEDPTVPEDARSRASSELHRFEQDQRVRARIEQRRQERLQGDKGP
jgi:hypothetical protein